MVNIAKLVVKVQYGYPGIPFSMINAVIPFDPAVASVFA